MKAAFVTTFEQGMVQEPTLAWLIRLRWAAVIGQIVVVIFASWMGLVVPTAVIVGLIGITAATNIGFQLRENRASLLRHSLFGGILFFDTLTFTALLACTGGVHNPFAAFYLVHVAMAAVALGTRGAWTMAGMVTLCYTGLFLQMMWSGNPHAHMMMMSEDLHLQGMVMATSITAISIAYFAGRLGLELRERERALGELRLVHEHNERFAALATLAGGVAHEIATPLGTMAIAAKELERAASRLTNGAELVEDARLIRAEARRCREILDRLNEQSNGRAGETASVTKGKELWNDVLVSLSVANQSRTRFEGDPELKLIIPKQAMTQAIVSLLKNSFEASGPEQPVWLKLFSSSGGASLVIQDEGCGIPPEITTRVGEPFLTTKGPGKGMGLGVFLVRTLVARLGGKFSIASELGKGTTVKLEVPTA